MSQHSETTARPWFIGVGEFDPEERCINGGPGEELIASMEYYRRDGIERRDAALIVAAVNSFDEREAIRTERDTLRAEIDALKAEREWQPIETAPKDGTEIVAFRPLAEETGDPRIVVCKTSKHPKLSSQGVEHFTDRWCHPTHWMPLPPAPEAPDAAL